MALLELEITDKLMEKLQKRAEAFSVDPSDVAKNIISCALATKEKPSWYDSITVIVSRVAEIVATVAHIEEKSE